MTSCRQCPLMLVDRERRCGSRALTKTSGRELQCRVVVFADEQVLTAEFSTTNVGVRPKISGGHCKTLHPFADFRGEGKTHFSMKERHSPHARGVLRRRGRRGG